MLRDGLLGWAEFEYDCVAAEREDRKLYKVGAHIELTFVENELKQPVLYTNRKVADTHALNLVEIRIGEDLNQIPSKS